MAKRKYSSLISKDGTYSTTRNSKFISTEDFARGEGHYKYIPKTKEKYESTYKVKG